MSSGNLILWEADSAGPAVARIAIAGDFLPAGQLMLPADAWRGAARGLLGHFQDVSTSFVNLEGALACDGLPRRPLTGLGTIVSAPEAALDYLEVIRACHAVSIANNHVGDFGLAGICHTRASLARRGIVPVGAGHTLREPPETFIWSGPENIRVGFWAAARASADLSTRRVPGIEPATRRRAAQAMETLRAHRTHFSIALLHAGCLRTNRPDPDDAELMESIADCGFSLVAASHSHRIAGARLSASRGGRPSFCFYGLGSIVSGYASSVLEQEGLIVVASLDRRGELARIEVRPVQLAKSGFGEVPPLETGAEILGRFRILSREIATGTSRSLFFQDVSPGLLRLYARDVHAAWRASGIAGLVRKIGRLRMRHFQRLVRAMVG